MAQWSHVRCFEIIIVIIVVLLIMESRIILI